MQKSLIARSIYVGKEIWPMLRQFNVLMKIDKKKWKISAWVCNCKE